MKPLPEISDFHLFLAHLLVEMSKNETKGVNKKFEQPERPWFTKKGRKEKITTVPFWLGKLGRYNIADESIHETHLLHIDACVSGKPRPQRRIRRYRRCHLEHRFRSHANDSPRIF